MNKSNVLLFVKPFKSTAISKFSSLEWWTISLVVFDFTSINVINDADINSTTPTAIVMAGAGMDVRQHFAVGDVLHAQDDILLGTVESIDAAATGPINLTSATSGAGDATTVANGDTIYNIHPIEIILGFEY